MACHENGKWAFMIWISIKSIALYFCFERVSFFGRPQRINELLLSHFNDTLKVSKAPPDDGREWFDLFFSAISISVTRSIMWNVALRLSSKRRKKETTLNNLGALSFFEYFNAYKHFILYPPASCMWKVILIQIEVDRVWIGLTINQWLGCYKSFGFWSGGHLNVNCEWIYTNYTHNIYRIFIEF